MCSSTSNELPCRSAMTRSYHCCCMAFWACSSSDCVMESLHSFGPRADKSAMCGAWAEHPLAPSRLANDARASTASQSGKTQGKGVPLHFTHQWKVDIAICYINYC